ncbi:TonB-dependent receptor plug domain-containing protein [Luteimonas saliphila]|uniref:TonB-dependent receptor plug domain-containing protein n=1 Tax=Luteimonas saliphila TaxID=2804919 RepID=UPI00192D4FF7|nr:TonB-dependent receptor plug domain-containing protein [Luteimonas saliphila]
MAWIAALALCPAGTPWAQAPGPAITPPTRDLDTLRVTASILPTAANDAGQNITVLGPERLEAWRGRSVAEVLAAQAGLMVDRSARGGGYGALYLRGADPSHVVILVDGVRQNDPLSSRGSAVDLNTLSLERIERIEIVRGSASVAHAEAIAGLVHLHTRRAAEGASASVAIGGDGLRSRHAGLSGGGWSLAASDREDGDGRHGFQGVRAFDAAGEREVLPALSLRAAFGYSDSEGRGFPDDSGGPRYAVLRELDDRHARARQVSLQARYRPAVGEIEARWARFSREGDEDSPGVAGGARDPIGLPALAAQTDYRRDELQATWRRPLGGVGEFGAGVLHQREHGRYDGRIDYGFFQAPVAFAMQRTTDAAFAELRWRHGSWTAQGGLRQERRRDAGAGADHASQPILSLQRQVGASGAHWGASFSRSSRPPSFYALGHPLVGNPGLRLERAEHRELHYATAGDAAWPSRITLFGARYRDLVDFDGGPPPQLVNRARIEADGVEWRSGRRFGNDWRLGLDGAWMRVRDPLGGVVLRYRPRLQAGADLTLPLGQHELSLRLHHLGRRFDSSIPTGGRWLAAMTTFDLALRRQWGPATVLLALDDATDARGEEAIGLDTPGRRLRLALRWDLQ